MLIWLFKSTAGKHREQDQRVGLSPSLELVPLVTLFRSSGDMCKERIDLQDFRPLTPNLLSQNPGFVGIQSFANSLHNEDGTVLTTLVSRKNYFIRSKSKPTHHLKFTFLYIGSDFVDDSGVILMLSQSVF